MREIHRKIVSAVIFSKDGRMLLGKKDPVKGGVYPDCWHIPGGGIDDGEDMLSAMKREIKEEVGIDILDEQVTLLEHIGHGESEKTLKDTGEKVLCHMEFNKYEVHLAENADDVELVLDDDLIEAGWFTTEELPNLKYIPGGREFFEEMGYIKS